MKWLKRGIFLLPLFIFCAEFSVDKKTGPFIMPMLPQEKGKPSLEVKGDGSILVEDFDAFVKSISEEKIKTKAYLRLDCDSGLYTEGTFTLD